MHKRGRTASAKPCSEGSSLVNNLAAERMDLVNDLPAGEDGMRRKVPRPARSTVAKPKRFSCRTPAGSRAPVRRSERTSSREDPCISSTSDGSHAKAGAITLNRKAKDETLAGNYSLCWLRLGARSP